jgi:hypothetical protein
MNNDWYVYRHVRLDTNVPFYVGLGRKENFSRAYTTKGRNKDWHTIVSQTKYEVEIMVYDLRKEDGKRKEREFIQLYGRAYNGSGTLCNIKKGGDGVYERSEETKKFFSELHKGNTYFKGKNITESHKKSISEAQKGKFVSEETREKLRQANLGKKNSNGADKRSYAPITEEMRKRISEKMKGKPKSEETKKKMSEYWKGKVYTDEVKKKISETLKAKNKAKRELLEQEKNNKNA